VVRAAKNVAQIFSEAHRVPVDMDLLLMGALLHDVSKVVENERKEGKYANSFRTGITAHTWL
jgi:putative nucleotidyltransferase with HDIG domain